MKLIDVTNSYATLVSKQLENTDAYYVKVYSLGKTVVVHSIAETHVEIVIVNNHREIKETEIDYILDELLSTTVDNKSLSFLRAKSLVEISMATPVKNK